MAITIGVILFLITCLFAVGVVRVANRSIREYDESTHESFLGK